MPTEKYGFVYIWRDSKKNMHYIGCHWGTEDDGYLCSSTRMRNAFNRRPADFKRRVIQRVYTNRIELLEAEHKWLQLIPDDELKTKYYNMSKRHFGHWSSSPDARSIAQKSGNTRRGKPLGPCSEETRQKISQANSGKKRSEETKRLLSELKKGATLTEEHREKISSSHKSKKEGYVHHTKLPGWTPKPAKLGSCVTCGSPTPSRRAKFCKSHFTTKPN